MKKYDYLGMTRHLPSSFFSYCIPCFSLCQYWATYSFLTVLAGSHHSVFAHSSSFASFLYLIGFYQTQTFLMLLADSSSSLTLQLFTSCFTNCIVHRIVRILPYWNEPKQTVKEMVYSENLKLIGLQWVLNFWLLLEIVEQRIWGYSLVFRQFVSGL